MNTVKHWCVKKSLLVNKLQNYTINVVGTQ